MKTQNLNKESQFTNADSSLENILNIVDISPVVEVKEVSKQEVKLSEKLENKNDDDDTDCWHWYWDDPEGVDSKPCTNKAKYRLYRERTKSHQVTYVHSKMATKSNLINQLCEKHFNNGEYESQKLNAERIDSI